MLAAIIALGKDYGRGEKAQSERVNVEYVSANPTGPMHVGHGRGAVFGDALCDLLSFAGYDVTREYYINDAGAQVDVLARSAFLRYREALGEDIGEISGRALSGRLFSSASARRWRRRTGRGCRITWKPNGCPVVRDAAIEAMMDMIRDDLAALAIRHDVFFSERSLAGGEDDAVRRHHCRSARTGPDLRGPPAPPQGGAGRGLGGSRADLVPRHAIRR